MKIAIWGFLCPFCDTWFFRRKKEDIKEFAKAHLREEQEGQETLKFLDPRNYLYGVEAKVYKD